METKAELLDLMIEFNMKRNYIDSYNIEDNERVESKLFKDIMENQEAIAWIEDYKNYKFHFHIKRINCPYVFYSVFVEMA